jgi:hypothetical protein
MADIAALPAHCRPSRTCAATLGLAALGAVMGAMLVTSADTIALAIRVARLQAIDLGSWLPLLSAGTLAGGQCLALMTAVATRLLAWPRLSRRCAPHIEAEAQAHRGDAGALPHQNAIPMFGSLV